MPGSAAKVVVTETQLEILQKNSRAKTVSVRHQQRAKIILLAFQGRSNQDIAVQVGLSRIHVGKWRRRWQQSWDALTAIECGETRAELQRAIQDVLSDAPRSGAPPKFTAKQVTEVLAIACEAPALSDRPIDFWTPREIANEAKRRKVVAKISTSHVGRLLSTAMLQPHRYKYWLNTKEKDPDVFQQMVETVCQTYLDAERLYVEANTHTVCVDEMTGIQAIERAAPALPMREGNVELHEFEYIRHGTQCLTANWHVVTGQVISPTIEATRTELDFALHIIRTVKTDPDASWVFVVDQLNTHQSETLARWVAAQEGISESSLGTKGRSGVLKSMASRREFLSDPSHRIRFVFLPKHSSWLNQVEVIFGIITRRVIRRGSFESTADLRERLLRFIEYFNETFAKPFEWTYTGRPVRAKPDRRPRTWRENWARSSKMRQTVALM